MRDLISASLYNSQETGTTLRAGSFLAAVAAAAGLRGAGGGKGGGGEDGGEGGGSGGGAGQVETVPETPSVRVVGQEQTVPPPT